MAEADVAELGRMNTQKCDSDPLGGTPPEGLPRRKPEPVAYVMKTNLLLDHGMGKGWAPGYGKRLWDVWGGGGGGNFTCKNHATLNN